MSGSKEATLIIKIKEAGAEILDHFVITAGDLVHAFEKVIEVLVDAVMQFKDQEDAVKSLNQAMINAGTFTAGLQNKYLEMASSLSKVTTFTDDSIVSAQALLQAQIGSKAVTEDLMKATLNLAAAKKIDLASAADMVGKTIAGETNFLQRQGITLDETAAATDRMGAVIEAVNHKFGGQAQAAGEGLGALTRLHNAFDDFTKSLVERFAPAISKIADYLAVMFNKMADWVGTNSLAAQSSKQLEDRMVALQLKINELNGSPIRKAFADMGVADLQVKALQDEMSKLAAAKDTAQAAELASIQNHNDAKKAQAVADLQAEETELMTEQQMFDQIKIDQVGKTAEQKGTVELTEKIKAQEKLYTTATTHQAKMAAGEQLHQLNMQKFRAKTDEDEVKNRNATLNTIATMQNSQNKTLATIGKAAAITQIAIATPVAIAQAMASGIPFPFNFAAAALVGVAMAAQAASIAGVQLAEGGIVMPRPGGIQATIGEGGQAEAVIPLDKAGGLGLGGGGQTIINMNVYGGMLGNESEARQFAMAVDKELLRLRQNHESVAFDSGVA